MKNYLAKETNKPDFPIRLQMLDARAMEFNPSRRSRVLEPCVSLKVTREPSAATPSVLPPCDHIAVP